jgi:hypothetical protein
LLALVLLVAVFGYHLHLTWHPPFLRK